MCAVASVDRDVKLGVGGAGVCLCALLCALAMGCPTAPGMQGPDAGPDAVTGDTDGMDGGADDVSAPDARDAADDVPDAPSDVPADVPPDVPYVPPPPNSTVTVGGAGTPTSTNYVMRIVIGAPAIRASATSSGHVLRFGARYQN